MTSAAGTATVVTTLDEGTDGVVVKVSGLEGSERASALAGLALAVMGGARVVRTDDVAACEAVCRTIDALLAAEAAQADRA